MNFVKVLMNIFNIFNTFNVNNNLYNNNNLYSNSNSNNTTPNHIRPTSLTHSLTHTPTGEQWKNHLNIPEVATALLRPPVSVPEAQTITRTTRTSRTGRKPTITIPVALATAVPYIVAAAVPQATATVMLIRTIQAKQAKQAKQDL
jgi:uncharacterized membrane protein